MGKISQFRLLFRGAIYNELHEYEVCCDLFAVVLISLSLSFTVKRSKFSLATSSSSSLSKSSINVEANKNSRHELQATPVGSFLSGLWSGLVQSSLVRVTPTTSTYLPLCIVQTCNISCCANLCGIVPSHLLSWEVRTGRP